MMIDALAQRFRSLPAGSPADALRLEEGSSRDYRQLSSYHYKGHQPGAVTKVYRLVHRAPTVVGRYLSRPDETTVVGALTRSLPHLACALRDHATAGRYRGLGAKASAHLVNREFRTISRVVIDPQWRGLGLSVRLMVHALAHPETIFTEALAAMGRVHPFCERAGMTRYDRPPHPAHARLLDALDHLGISPATLASTRAVRGHLDRCTETQQRWIERELKRWYRTGCHKVNVRIDRVQLDDLLHAAREHLLVQPIYYLKDHRPPHPPTGNRSGS